MNIPIVIICYNNYRYVENMLKQIVSINNDYYTNIIILNNMSTCADTIAYLNKVDVRVIHNVGNFGPWITPTNNRHIYDLLPDKYIITDPDLKLNPNIPSNFIEILTSLSDKYKTSKIGFALDITDHDMFYPTTEYMANLSIRDWELRFWQNKIGDEGEYEIYKADIDTTFCLMNKTNIESYLQIRVAGDFTAKHIPWYIENEVYNVYDNYMANTNTAHISTISRIVLPYINENYMGIHKNRELFFIKKDDTNPNLTFWKDTYGGWNNELFELFDNHLSKEKVFIDIGMWITPTSMYGARKAKHTYAIAMNIANVDELCMDMKANCANYTVITRNDTSVEAILTEHAINKADISLINVDIRGEEENILNNLYDLHSKYNVHLHICFHYNIWKDKNLDRFPYLSEINKNCIATTQEPISIFF